MSKVFNMVGGGGGPAASIFVTGLSQTDTVTATNGSKTLTGKWTHKPNPEFITLPDGYTQLEYIESTGTQYINTGIILKQNYNVDLKANISDSNSNIWLFGSDNDTKRFGIQAEMSGSTLQGHAIFCADYWTDYVSISTNQLLNIRYSLENTQKFLIDDVLYGTKSNTISDAALPLYLFANNQRGSAISLAKMKCYRFTISLSGSSAINDFIPAKRNSDSVIGLYDLANDVFYTNAGTGAFTAGPEIPQTIGGFLIKPIRDFGTWTVTATDGVRTAIQDVLVDVITEYKIEMSYKLWLYRDGDECEDVTGGWTSGRYPSNGAAYWTTNNAISLDGYSKICFDVEIPESSNTVNLGVGDISDSTGELSYCYSNRGTYTGVVEHSTDGIPDGSYLVRALITNTPFYSSTSVTLSKNKNSLYIYYAWYTSAYVTTLTVKRIWLE